MLRHLDSDSGEGAEDSDNSSVSDNDSDTLSEDADDPDDPPPLTFTYALQPRPEELRLCIDYHIHKGSPVFDPFPELNLTHREANHDVNLWRVNLDGNVYMVKPWIRLWIGVSRKAGFEDADLLAALRGQASFRQDFPDLIWFRQRVRQE